MGVLVLGIGNLVMGDDGVGVRVVQHLQEQHCFSDEVTVLDGGTLGLDLLPHLERAERVVVVDAVETGQPPGTLIRLTGEEVPCTLETKVSPHQMGLKDLLAVASLLGKAPEEMVLWGVQPESVELSTELSPRVEAQVTVLADQVLNELSKWGAA